MRIKPIIEQCVVRNAHPLGCEQHILSQINYVKSQPILDSSPKRVLVLGSSGGLGLAARIALTFGANAKTIGVSLDSAPTEDRTGSAGFFNNHYFKYYAQKEGHLAVNIQGDVFDPQTKTDVIEAIETYFEGEVDLIVYSIAAPKRRKPDSDRHWHSTIKPLGHAVPSVHVDIGEDLWHSVMLEPALPEELESTVRVMGGEDWASWIDTLVNSESIAEGCQTIAFSYMGPDITHPLYLDGTLGHAKVDLHQTSHALNLELANFDGAAYAVVCKALVTRASLVIPGLVPYMASLQHTLALEGHDEDCIEQMTRLCQDILFNEHVKVDGERLIRLDNYELDEKVQATTRTVMADLNAENFAQFSGYQQLKKRFMQLHGFAWDGIDYSLPVDMKVYKKSSS